MPAKDTTSLRVAKIASDILRNPASGRACKTVAGSALVQTPGRKKRKTNRSHPKGRGW